VWRIFGYLKSLLGRSWGDELVFVDVREIGRHRLKEAEAVGRRTLNHWRWAWRQLFRRHLSSEQAGVRSASVSKSRMCMGIRNSHSVAVIVALIGAGFYVGISHFVVFMLPWLIASLLWKPHRVDRRLCFSAGALFG